ncbi:MAG: hypothetical protein IPF92_11020 [Myxococcales bacterium]|nr:hypothetical protein [Myxococcales bacterium]
MQKPPRKPVPVEARVGDGKVHVQLDGPTPAGKPQAPPPTPSGYKGAY